jgi:hypothetical protein
MFKNDTQKLVGEIEDAHSGVIMSIGRCKNQLAGFKTGFLKRHTGKKATHVVDIRSAIKVRPDTEYM